MTVRRGIVHSERGPEEVKPNVCVDHGIQLWVELPDAFEEVEQDFVMSLVKPTSWPCRDKGCDAMLELAVLSAERLGQFYGLCTRNLKVRAW